MIERIHAHALAMPRGASQLFIVPWGGRVAAAGPDESPLGGPRRPLRRASAGAVGRPGRRRARDRLGTRPACRPGRVRDRRRVPELTGDEGPARVIAQYGEAGYARLARVKANWDPDDVFHGSGHVPPAARLPGGIELAFAATGRRDGAPVVLLHGLFDQWRSFAPVMAHLDGDVRAYAITQRGHTGSSRPATGYAIANLAGDVLAFLDALGIERAVLAGHSLGALSALQASVLAPERVAGLVLAPGFASAQPLPAVRELLDAVGAMDEELDREFVEYLQRQAREPQLPDGFFETMVESTLRMPLAVCRALLEGITAFELERELPSIAAPALLLWGDEDAIVSRRQLDALASGLSEAEVRIISGCGHTPHWHDPRGLRATLARFAARVTSR